MSEVVLKNINKTYENGYCAVKNFNLEIKKNEFLILVGPSGCGKSTTLRMIAGLEEITDGELWIQGNLSNFTAARERELAMVFQNYALYQNMSVYDNIAFSLAVRKVAKKEIKARVEQIARMLGLSQLLDRRPKDLSGGQKQRVAIGNAIIRDSKVLLMDEPLSNLDAKLRNQMRVELSNLHKKLGNTIIYVTHDQTEAMTLGTRIVVMDQGEIQQVDTPEQLYHNPKNRFVAGFIGTPPMNFFEGSIVDLQGRICVEVMDRQLTLSEEQEAVIRREGQVGKAVVVGIRPEAFRIIKDVESVPVTEQIHVTVNHIENLGKERIIYFEANGKQCAFFGIGDEIRISDHIALQVKNHEWSIFDQETERNIFYPLKKQRRSI